MRRFSRLWRIYTGLGISLCLSISSLAQDTSVEFWPEMDIWYRLNPAWRLSAFLPITKYHESTDRDFNIYLQVDYAWGKTRTPFFNRRMDENKQQQLQGWMLRGGYMGGWSLYDHGENYSEDMAFLEIHKRIPFKGEELFSNRIRVDTRWIGQESKFSYRIRYRMMIEKELTAGRTAIVPYVNVEPYWDSRYAKIIKTRAIGGAAVSWRPRFALEGNITYQYDESYDTKNLYAFNLILHLYFETRHKRDDTSTGFNEIEHTSSVLANKVGFY